MPKITDGTSWGTWRLVASNLTLQYKDGAYEIDLEKITNSAQMLDWIFQIREKVWATPAVMTDLLSAFEALFSPQANLCGGGGTGTIDAEKHLRRVVDAVAPNPGGSPFNL
jgi:hypothetical protein